VSELVFERLGEEPVDYLEAWQRQRDVHAQVVEGGPGTVLLLEHSPVYTAGKRTEPHERPTDGTPVVEVDRGGKITFHGPGQLVGYPIVRLPDHVLVVDFVRRLEEALIGVCADLGVTTARVPGRSGVWLEAGSATGSGAPRPERKIAAIGIRVSKQTTMHGFALNVTSQLTGFDNIVPCGIADAGVTSMAAELHGPAPTLTEVARTAEPHLSELLALRPYRRHPEFAAPDGVSVVTR
jgi:lipoyl(octanoyl) transferase